MANLVPVNLDNIQVPAHIASRQVNNDIFAAGLPQGGGFPMIGLKGTRFVVKADGSETALPSLEIGVILISAKPNLDKAYYATKFDPNQSEVKSPDCFSKDGTYPDPTSTLKQHTACAGCPQNQFGSGIDAAGNPSKGKACTDTKMLAIYANGGVFGFKIPPASLKNFMHYVKETGRRGIDLTCGITLIGFDTNFSFPVLTFQFGGFLAPEQIAKIDALKGSADVADIVGSSAVPTPAPVAIPAPPVVAEPESVQAPVVASDPFATVVEVKEAPKAEKPKKEKVVEMKPAPQAAAQVTPEDVPAGDAALAAMLGINL